MLDTFDPSVYSSPGECVRELEQLGIPLGHRLGARVFGLGRRGVRFSLAFLEEAQQGGPARDVLMDPGWMALPLPLPVDRVSSLIDSRPASALESAGLIHVLTPDEVLPDEKGAMVPISGGDGGSLLPSVLGADARAFGGALWERRRMEQASLCLLDGEDSDELVESFRYLFRALLATGQTPLGLMVTALGRQKRGLSREVARQVRDHLSRELGRALLELLSDDPGQMAGALRHLLGEGRKSWRELLPVVLLPALVGALETAEGRTVVFDSLEPLAQVVGGTLEQLERLLDAMLDRLPELGFAQRVALGRFLAGISRTTPGLVSFLLRRAKQAVDPHQQAFFCNVLSRAELDGDQIDECVEMVAALFATRGLETALQERLRATMMNLGKAPLEHLSRPEWRERLEADQRIWLIHLWNQYREEGLELPDEGLFAELARSEILARRRGSMLALVRSGQLCHPSLVQALVASSGERELVINYLLGEAFRMEEPDDEVVFDLLACFGPEVLDPAFRRLREEAALGSAAAAHRMFFFARLASRLAARGVDLQSLLGMARECLKFPIYTADAHPSVWLGLGYLGSVPGLSMEVIEAVVDRLSDNLAHYPEQKVEAVLLTYPAADEALRCRVEQQLRQVLEADTPDRRLLKACLDGLERLLSRGAFLVEPERLVADLCRTVLWRGKEQDLQRVLRQALSYRTEGDGVRLPCAWAKEDRDQALRILGEVACHPATPDRLHQLVCVRLFSFLQDWLEAVEQGQDLYAHRDTPLWELLEEVLRIRPGGYAFEAAAQIGLKVLELQRRCPRNLGLAWRERAQRFLVTLVEHDVGRELKRGGVAIDLPASLLRILTELEAVEEQQRPVSLYLLRELADRGGVRPDLRPQLELYLKTRLQ